MRLFMQLSPGSAKAARQHRDGVDTTSASALNLVKHDCDKCAAYFYHLILLLKERQTVPTTTERSEIRKYYFIEHFYSEIYVEFRVR